MSSFTTPEWIGLISVILIMGMSKGGLPIAGVALPLLILMWPEQGQAARSAVSFMLPLLCVMDVVGVILYRGSPDWSHIRKLLAPTVAGIIVASLLFVSDKGISFSDRTLKLVIGFLGLAFTGWQFWGKKRAGKNAKAITASSHRPAIYGFAGGLTSTIAHAAGPVMQMYFLPTGLAKRQFAATTVYYFLFLNAMKLIPFALLGRFSREQLSINLMVLPVIPAGVVIGYLIVRLMKEHHYTGLIYFTLSTTSALLIYRALSGT